jgi:hypothetical protein
MKLIKCPNCGNVKEFYEQATFVKRNDFVQNRDGRIEKVGEKQDSDSCGDSQIYCSACGYEIDEDYHLLLDRYTEALFEQA